MTAHDWVSVTGIKKRKGASVAMMKCTRCGVQGRGYLGSHVRRLRPYDSRIYECCDSAVAHLEKRGGTTKQDPQSFVGFYSIIVQRGRIRVQCFARVEDGWFKNTITGKIETPLQIVERVIAP